MAMDKTIARRKRQANGTAEQNEKGQKALPADYGDATPEDVARAIFAPVTRRRGPQRK